MGVKHPRRMLNCRCRKKKKKEKKNLCGKVLMAPKVEHKSRELSSYKITQQLG